MIYMNLGGGYEGILYDWDGMGWDGRGAFLDLW